MARRMRSKATDGRARDDAMRSNIVRGLAGVALASGLLAVGAALASRRNREMIRKGAKSALERVSYAAKSVGSQGEMGRAVAHRVSTGRRARRTPRRGGMRKMTEEGKEFMGRAVAHRVGLGRRRGMGEKMVGKMMERSSGRGRSRGR